MGGPILMSVWEAQKQIHELKIQTKEKEENKVGRGVWVGLERVGRRRGCESDMKYMACMYEMLRELIKFYIF